MKISCAWLSIIASSQLAASVAGGPCYDTEVLWGQPCFLGFAGVTVDGIAPDGTVVAGTALCATIPVILVWKPDGTSYLIPPPTGTTHVGATDINGNGQVSALSGSNGYIYDLRGEFYTTLSLPPDGTYTKPLAINNHGDTAGEWGNSLTGVPFLQHAYSSKGPFLFDLGALLLGPYNKAYDISDDGTVVGSMGNFFASSSLSGFVWRDRVVTFLGSAPGCHNSSAAAVNEHDEVACTGSEPITGGSIGHAFIWREGVWTQLDHLPGYEDMSANDINDFGIVVGNAFSPGETDFVWIGGVTYDLNLRLIDSMGVYIKNAVALNNAGQIACNGEIDHPIYGWTPVGVRLTPRPPQPADFTDDCAVNGEDLMILLQSWGPLPPSPAPGSGRGAGGEGKRNANSLPRAAADLDGNGIVNGYDLAMLLAAWG